MAILRRKLFFFLAGGPATPIVLLQYNYKHVSVGPSPTPAVVNHKVHNEYQGRKLAIFGRKLIFFVLAALQSPICCCNTPTNTFQWVLPRPRRSSVTKCIMNTKKNTVFGTKLAIHGHFWGKTDFFFVLAARQAPICCCNTTANTF